MYLIHSVGGSIRVFSCKILIIFINVNSFGNVVIMRYFWSCMQKIRKGISSNEFLSWKSYKYIKKSKATENQL